MREEESNWFAKWEEELPSPDELISLSHTLITPDLAMAFDIRNFTGIYRLQPPPSPPLQTRNAPSSPCGLELSELDESLGGGGGGTGGAATALNRNEPVITLKRPRLVWTPQLHRRFADTVAHLGIKNAVPKTIMQFMSVDSLTRENVASHLQKYKLYLKRMQGISNGGSGGGESDCDAPFSGHRVFIQKRTPVMQILYLLVHLFLLIFFIRFGKILTIFCLLYLLRHCTTTINWRRWSNTSFNRNIGAHLHQMGSLRIHFFLDKHRVYRHHCKILIFRIWNQLKQLPTVSPKSKYSTMAAAYNSYSKAVNFDNLN